MNLRSIIRRIKVGENMAYVLVWAIIFLVPFIYTNLKSEEPIALHDVLTIWGKILPYYIIFLLNNYLLAPFLLLRQRYMWYIVSLIIIDVAVFGNAELLSPENGIGQLSLNQLQLYWSMLLGIVIAGINSMIKLYYRAIVTTQRMAMLEKEAVESQMEYLKHQINPHFLMNTLNNIHAMIDFDTEMAKKSVVELSHLLRHVLYDSSEKYTTLDKEVEFIDSYIKLMRIRYIDEVNIEFNTPDIVLCRKIKLPPLLLIVLVENAFKHGISYDANSYVKIDIMAFDDELTCIVANSRHEVTNSNTEHSGIGLSNITRRLEMLFGKRYTLTIDDSDAKRYSVELVIPITDR
ncbi:MAG: sensor histidine kinase [Alistipes sp.]|nr:sensor histidine kinase [Alistipes sp.]